MNADIILENTVKQRIDKNRARTLYLTGKHPKMVVCYKNGDMVNAKQKPTFLNHNQNEKNEIKTTKLKTDIILKMSKHERNTNNVILENTLTRRNVNNYSYLIYQTGKLYEIQHCGHTCIAL